MRLIYFNYQHEDGVTGHYKNVNNFGQSIVVWYLFVSVNVRLFVEMKIEYAALINEVIAYVNTYLAEPNANYFLDNIKKLPHT